MLKIWINYLESCSSLRELSDISKWELNNDLTLENIFDGLILNNIPILRYGRIEFQQ